MDIARTPSTPDGNPEMADAAPEPKAPLLIRREDYAPFAWLVPEIALEFDLGLERTRDPLGADRAAQRQGARDRRRSASTATGSTPLEVAVDGQAINAGAWTATTSIVPLTGGHAPDRDRRPRSIPRPTAS